MAPDEFRTWLHRFECCVQRQDYEGAKLCFHDDAYSFGSYADVCGDLDELAERQWKQTWPHISDFRFDLGRLRVDVSADRRLAVLMLCWSSTGYHEDRTSFARGGRVTILLTRAAPSDPWRASHTHYSLTPGTPTTARPA